MTKLIFQNSQIKIQIFCLPREKIISKPVVLKNTSNNNITKLDNISVKFQNEDIKN